MFSSVRDIDLDNLRSNHSRMYYFGLGFVQLKIDETWRLHFYSPELPPVTEEVHDHRYDFESTTLAGAITNAFFDVQVRPPFWGRVATNFERDKMHVMRAESCNPSVEAPSTEIPCEVSLSGVKTFAKGDVNRMSHHRFHRVTSGDCITLLKRGPYQKEFAHVVSFAGTKPVCPFSVKIPEEDLWGIMGRMVRRHR